MRTVVRAALACCTAVGVWAAHPYEADEPSEADVAAFRAWYQEWHAANKKISVKDTMEWGLGVYAEAPIKHKEKILQVPGEFVMTVDKARQRAAASGDKLMGQTFKNMNKEYVMYAWLLWERGLGETSTFYPWFRVLPRTFHNPLHFTDEEITHIEPKETRLRVNEQRAKAKKIFKYLRHLIPMAAPRAMALDDVTWAMSVVATRSWHIRGQQYLVPVAGMFNHAPDAEDAAYDPRNPKTGRSMKFLTYHSILEDGSAMVLSDRRVATTDQVFESYGDNANSIYFEHHGFVQEDNPYDCITLSFKKLLDADFDRSKGAAAAQKFDVGRRYNFPQEYCFHKEEVPAKVLMLHAVAALPEDKVTCLDGIAARHTFSRGVLDTLLECGGHELETFVRFERTIREELRDIFHHRSKEREQAVREGRKQVSNRVAMAMQHRAALRGVAESVQAVLNHRIRELAKGDDL